MSDECQPLSQHTGGALLPGETKIQDVQCYGDWNSNPFSFDSDDDDLSAPGPAEAGSGTKDNFFSCDSDNDDDAKRGPTEGGSGIKDNPFDFFFGDPDAGGPGPSTASNARPSTSSSFSFEAAGSNFSRLFIYASMPGISQKRRYDSRGLLLGTWKHSGLDAVRDNVVYGS